MAERANGILLDNSVVIAQLRGSVDLQTMASPDEPLFLPLAMRSPADKSGTRPLADSREGSFPVPVQNPVSVPC